MNNTTNIKYLDGVELIYKNKKFDSVPMWDWYVYCMLAYILQCKTHASDNLRHSVRILILIRTNNERINMRFSPDYITLYARHMARFLQMEK